MNGPKWPLLSGIMGGGILVAAFFVKRDDPLNFWQQLLIEVGASLILVVPITVIASRLEQLKQRVDELRGIGRAQERLDRLNDLGISAIDVRDSGSSIFPVGEECGRWSRR